MSEDFYEALGVSRDASEDEIKTAYRKKAAEYHPDVSDDPNAEEKFKKIEKAKEVLTDEEKRQAYDQMGHDRFEQAEKRGGFDGQRGGAGGFGGGGMGGMGGGGFEDIFEQFFGGGRGGGGQRRNQPRQGRNLRTSMEITLEEAYHGTEKEFTITRPETCPDCNGEGHPPDAEVTTCPECNGTGEVTRVQQTPFGRVQQRSTCPRCGGEGETADKQCSTCGGDGIVDAEVTLTVEVPAGIKSGQTLRMDGEGAPGENGGPNGDLLIDIEIADHDTFERDGDDLHYNHAISFPQAVFGDTVEIPTLDGTKKMEIPEGTQSGEQFRLRGEGMPRLRGRRSGHLFVTVQVVTPDSLNKKQREALEQFAEAGGEEVDVSEGFFEKIKNSF
ncbi:MAG: molecular chaperone DnaJ [Halohasta sp.]